VLIGAVTVLVAIVAVFLAYNANNGLPFVPTRELKVDVANGASLVAGNDVTQGGYRIGIVSQMRPIQLSNGTVGAELTLQLNQNNGRVPVDSTVAIRPRSALGLKYLDLELGHSSKVFPDGGTLPARQTSVPVQFDDINQMFDARTRPAVQKDLELTRVLGALGGFFGTISPVAQTNERLFADQATTFAAISRDPSALESTIRQSPSTLDVSTASLRVQQPFLSDLTTFSDYMGPATGELRQALPNVDPALEAGIRVLPRTPSMNVKLQALLSALRSLALDPGTNVALNGLSDTTGTLNPMIRYLGPYVTVCNDWNYFWVEIADLVSEQTNFGMAQRALIQFPNHQTNNVGNQGAYQPANGYQTGDIPGTSGTADAEYLHSANYGAAVNSQGNADCETGQRGYPAKLNYFDSKQRNLDMAAHTPGNQGSTWSGLSRVPPGETFTRSPTTGPQLPYDPTAP
jgi:ABC-type transporter Mla subunit MlaD